MGKQNILNFFNENALRVRVEILQVLVEDIISIETDFIKIKDKLYDIGQFLYKDSLVMLDNGIGVMREDGTASRLNVHALTKFAMDNFGWGGKHIIEVENGRKIKGSKAAPAASIFELFRWSEAVFRIRHGPNAQSKLIIGDFVKSEIQRALGRKHALSLSARISKKRLISGIEPEIKDDPKKIKDPKKPKKMKDPKKPKKIKDPKKPKKMKDSTKKMKDSTKKMKFEKVEITKEDEVLFFTIDNELSMELDEPLDEPLEPVSRWNHCCLN